MSAVKLMTLVRKEWLEQLRSFKLIWIPLVFALLGIMQPLTNYYMPVIIEKAGNMPEGAVIEMPVPSGAEVLAGTLSQFGMIGLLILALAFMGAVSGDRNSGAASLVLVKPVSFLSFILSKWLGMMTLLWGALLIGYAASWYYTWLLFETVDFAPFLLSYVLYGLWFTFILTAVLLFSTLLRSAAGAAFSALGLALLLTALSGIAPKYMGWSPSSLTGFAYEAVQGGFDASASFGWSIGVTILLIAAGIAGSSALLRRQPALD
ncbi:ABC transporter permease [Paenibacillus nanensis]|uniref:ABC transporter permease n=1 Tax=Paenibacillus nanensis TaxID=393251 RepID=A0A3A1UWP7_9BACL|nr:ABC transporter permease subunit [Paenibacillus nanensis]RIX50753.1 ABC transporter permease [Paenibacillus nanensis]